MVNRNEIKRGSLCDNLVIAQVDKFFWTENYYIIIMYIIGSFYVKEILFIYVKLLILT